MEEEREKGAAVLRQKIMEAMLICCGEVGFQKLSVERVVQGYGGNRSQFYRHFRSKTECYIAAYEWKANQLADCAIAMLEAEGAPDEHLRRALEAVASLLVDHEALAKGLFLDVHLAGRDAFLKRKEVIDRLSKGLDIALRQKPDEVDPPPLTAEFLINAVDQAASSALRNGRARSFGMEIPELALLVLLLYGRGAGDPPSGCK